MMSPRNASPLLLPTTNTPPAPLSRWLRQQTTQKPPVPDGVILEPGIVYGQGGGEPLLLDLTRPKKGKGPFPAIIFIHGGGWVGGERESFYPFLFHFSKLGYVCITASYRLSPAHRFPAHVEDTKCAVRWMRANARKYNVAADRIGALGGSAGAHLVAMLGTTAGDKRWEGKGGNAEYSSAIRAMICWSGPYDLEMGYRNSYRQNEQEGKAVRGMLEAFLGGTPDTHKSAYRDASPITYASKNSVPTLLTHGTADTLVLIEQSEVFAQLLKSKGAKVDLLRIEGGGHADFGPKPQEVIDRIVAFVQSQLGR